MIEYLLRCVFYLLLHSNPHGCTTRWRERKNYICLAQTITQHGWHKIICNIIICVHNFIFVSGIIINNYIFFHSPVTLRSSVQIILYLVITAVEWRVVAAVSLLGTETESTFLTISSLLVVCAYYIFKLIFVYLYTCDNNNNNDIDDNDSHGMLPYTTQI